MDYTQEDIEWGRRINELQHYISGLEMFLIHGEEEFAYELQAREKLRERFYDIDLDVSEFDHYHSI